MKTKLLGLGLLMLCCLGSSPNLNNPSQYFPVLMHPEDLEQSVKYLPARDIENPGKIYYKDQTIYLNEKYKGIHVIDNSDPNHPQNVAFINIPGCIDIAIKNHNLLADNATDMVSIDISNLQSLRVTERIKNVFPELTPPDLDYLPYMFEAANRPENTVIVGWELYTE